MDRFCGGAGFWGPGASGEGHKYGPAWFAVTDFSTCFEEVVIVVVPTVFMLTVGLVRFLQVSTPRHSQMAYLPPLQPTRVSLWRQISIYLLLAMQLLKMVDSIWHQAPGFQIFSPSLVAVGLLFAYLLLTKERLHLGKESHVLPVFFLLSVIGRIIRTRTDILKIDHRIYDWTRFALSIAELLLFLFAFVLSILHDARKVNEEQSRFDAKGSLFSSIFFWWITPFMRVDDFDLIVASETGRVGAEDGAEKLELDFMEAHERFSTQSLNKALLVAFGGPFVYAGILKFCHEMLAFTGPLFLRYLITFMYEYHQPNSTRPYWHGYAAVLGLSVAWCAKLICIQQYRYRITKFSARVSAALRAAIFRKSLQLSPASRVQCGPSEIMKLITVQVKDIQESISCSHNFWSLPLNACICAILLWRELSVHMLPGILVLVILYPIQQATLEAAHKAKAHAFDVSKDRLHSVTQAFPDMLGLFMNTMESLFFKVVRKLRKDELQSFRKSMRWIALTESLTIIGPFLALVASLCSRPDSHKITSQSAFVSILIFHMLYKPISGFEAALRAHLMASQSKHRVVRFLQLEEFVQETSIMQPDTDNSQKMGSLHNTFYRYGPGSAFVLRDVTLELPKGSVTLVHGRFGSGKTSLLRALLGRLERVHGQSTVCGDVALVSQNPTVCSGTVRQNIIGDNALGNGDVEWDEDWYQTVVNAAALEPDFSILSNGDETVVGEGGFRLSKAQMIRINLGRVLYQKVSVCLLDNIFIGLHPLCVEHICSHLFAADSPFSDITFVVTAHSFSTWNGKVDQLFELHGGKLEEQSVDELLNSDKDELSSSRIRTISTSSSRASGLDVLKAALGSRRGSIQMEQRSNPPSRCGSLTSLDQLEPLLDENPKKKKVLTIA
eukprot:m.53496 g.53496  ORF g.53496 m.53496 type:complete len:895 (-) comp10869_c0_seq2:3404-6088(-)